MGDSGFELRLCARRTIRLALAGRGRVVQVELPHGRGARAGNGPWHGTDANHHGGLGVPAPRVHWPWLLLPPL